FLEQPRMPIAVTTPLNVLCTSGFRDSKFSAILDGKGFGNKVKNILYGGPALTFESSMCIEGAV
ncbi:hypothetical protein WG66_009526, partial [Moniliophthora roreri]